MNFFRTRKKDILLIGLFYLINFGLWELIAPFVSNKWASFLVYLILFLLVIILFSKEMRSAFVRMKQEKLKERKYYVSLLLWLLLNLLIGALLLWLAAILDLDILPKNNENVESQISTIPVVFAVIQGCFFAPVIEEMTFRYAMIEKSGNTCLYRASIVASIVLFEKQKCLGFDHATFIDQFGRIYIINCRDALILDRIE
jgi:membrane protease YdiL (CAAX protease family)